MHFLEQNITRSAGADGKDVSCVVKHLFFWQLEKQIISQKRISLSKVSFAMIVF